LDEDEKEELNEMVESQPSEENSPNVETIPVGQTVTFEEEIPNNSLEETPEADDIPLEIKNYPSESIPKDTNKGEQLGLF
jgi:hypothetical protein